LYGKEVKKDDMGKLLKGFIIRSMYWERKWNCV